MTDTENAVQAGGALVRCYQVEVEGEVGADWADWFGADALWSDGGRTCLQVQITDQAQLHGLLRRIFDLHLELISLHRMESTSNDVGERAAG